MNDGSYRFTVEGVGKPGEYTLDDLKAMPQTGVGLANNTAKGTLVPTVALEPMDIGLIATMTCSR